MKIASEWGISDISSSLSGTELQQKELISSAARNYEFFCGFFAEPPLSKPLQFIEVASPFLSCVKSNVGQNPELYVPYTYVRLG